MNVYLDNNIIIDIEQEIYTRNELLVKIGEPQAKIFYSAVHLAEADEMKGIDKEQKLAKRCQTITDITSNNYLHLDANSHTAYKHL